MRITAGNLRGQKLARLHGRQIRPSAEKLRQAMFDVIQARGIENLEGHRVLDVFAGSGVLGFEALSRGADFVLFLDQDRQALATIRHNAAALGLDEGFDLRHRDVTRLGKRPKSVERFDLVFCDPPYGKGLGERALARLLAGDWLTEGAIVILEEAASASLALPPPLRELHRRRYGDSGIFWLILDVCA